jgi:hypothetical protein
MIVHEYTIVDDSIIFHTVNYNSIPKGATVRRSLPIEEFYSEDNLINTYFEVFHKNVGLELDDIKAGELLKLRERKKELMDIPVRQRHQSENDELCHITAKLGTLAADIEKTHTHIGRGLYVPNETYDEMLNQCRCLIVIGGSNTLTFSDLKRAITNYHDLICTTPNTSIEFWISGQEVGRFRLFQYAPREINQLEKVA